MSTGGHQHRRPFLLIDELELGAIELTRRRRRGPNVQEQGLTPAQKNVWNALHFLIHRRDHGYREGYSSYADICDHTGLSQSTVVDAVAALVAADLLLKRRRKDARGGKGAVPFYAPNAYFLLPPPSIRTDAEMEMVTALRGLWGQDEQLPPRRRSMIKASPPERAPLKDAPVKKDAPVNEIPHESEAEREDRNQARQMVLEFHRALGHIGHRPAAHELATARELIARFGVDQVAALANHVIQHDKPRSFVLVKIYADRLKIQAPVIGPQAAADPVVSDELAQMVGRLAALYKVAEAGDLKVDGQSLLLLTLGLSNDLDEIRAGTGMSSTRQIECLTAIEIEIRALEAAVQV